ncbi:hypothetical protein [Streptomyces sp. NPDC087525]|uniref:hypothetical protein n=1 Tax=Streptomyces sp. NPDC087525 TaxID=3365793 RepID=UPI00382E9479
MPIGDALAALLTEHTRKHPPVEVTLPWMAKDGEPVTVRLVFTTREHKPLNKNYFNYLWKGGLEAIGAIKVLNDKPVGKGRKWGECRDKMMHALRHLFASEAINEGRGRLHPGRPPRSRGPCIYSPPVRPPRNGSG